MRMEHVLNMGGYARYVWPAYGIAAIVLAWNVWSALRSHRDALAQAHRRVAIASGDAARRTP
jgi:heme exporter protein CcmD